MQSLFSKSFAAAAAAEMRRGAAFASGSVAAAADTQGSNPNAGATG